MVHNAKGRRFIQELPEAANTSPGKKGDRLINGLSVEYKHPSSGATAKSLFDMVEKSLEGGGQARHIVIDARNTGLTQEEAIKFIDKSLPLLRGPSRLDALEVIGDGYFIQATRMFHQLELPRPETWKWGGLGN